MRKISIIFIFLIMASANIRAETLKGGYGACISEDLFDQLTSAMVSNDNNELNYLLENGCIVTKPGINVTVLDISLLSGVSKVRAHIGNNAVILWTNSENIEK